MKHISHAFFTLSCGLIFSACAHVQPVAPQTLVLIQGVHADGTIWNETAKYLAGNAYSLTDLGRIGRDTKTPASLKNIAALSCEKIPNHSVLVGHSYGGAIANEMIGICPDKIAKIIYVSAVIPLAGEKPFDLLTKEDQKNYSGAVDFKAPFIIPKKANVFFSHTDKQVNLRAQLPRLYPEWMNLTAEAISYDENHFVAIPKIYIFTAKDPIITENTQHNYVARAKIQNIDSIATGHYPMVSNPAELAKIINKWMQ